jgi:molybdopterin molybdotransferase
MLSVDAAYQEIIRHMPRRPTVRVPIERAGGEVLREPVAAERDQPPFDRVTMDGIAIRHRAWAAGRRSYRSIGVQAAGAPARGLDDDGHCVEVMTGTPLPVGTDCVIPVERTSRNGDQIAVSEDAAPAVGAFVHRRGSDHTRDTALLAPGLTLAAPEMAVLASSGLATVAIAARPRIAVLPTGDELVAPGQPIAPHQIRRSNDYALSAALARRGFHQVVTQALPDDPEVMHARIASHLDSQDALILTGGVSMGQFDHLPAIMRSLGVEVVFHRIRQRPGKPMWFGVDTARKAVVFALPGNPVSSLVCLIRYALPALTHALGATQLPRMPIRLSQDVSFAPPLTWHLPVVVEYRDSGVPVAVPKPTNTSGDFASLAGTTGFVELPADRDRFPAGYVAPLSIW